MNKDHQKNTDLYHVLEIIGISGIETFHSLVREFPVLNEAEWVGFAHTPTEISKVLDAMKDRFIHLDKIREYCNEQFRELSITYHCSIPKLDDEYKQTSVKYNINGEIGRRV